MNEAEAVLEHVGDEAGQGNMMHGRKMLLHTVCRMWMLNRGTNVRRLRLAHQTIDLIPQCFEVTA